MKRRSGREYPRIACSAFAPIDDVQNDFAGS